MYFLFKKTGLTFLCKLYFSLQDLEKENVCLKEQLDKAISEKKLIEKTSSTELEPKLEVIF